MPRPCKECGRPRLTIEDVEWSVEPGRPAARVRDLYARTPAAMVRMEMDQDDLLDLSVLRAAQELMLARLAKMGVKLEAE
jgi:hypothetical protein